jgi:hypothetical protein
MSKRMMGEWWAGSDDDAHCVFATHGGDETVLVCEVGDCDCDAEKQAKTAEFIASAPKLLAACDRLWAAKEALEINDNPTDQTILRELYNAWLDLRDARNASHGQS